MRKPDVMFRNPVLKGFYPDPSICRVGESFYLVTSSFYYFPGLPVFKSKDLVHWKQICNAIDRPEQLDYRNCDISEGLWAPTIRYHDGLFYIVDTLDVNGRENRYNFILTAKNPAGPWSNAVVVEGADGIDPSLFFDEEGRIWFCCNHIPEQLAFPTHKQIILGQLDPQTFQFLEEPTVILDAAIDHSMYTEAPHLYAIGEWYYLLTASGGTQTNHCVNIYRSHNLQGPFEPCERNPIVSNRGLKMINSLGVCVTGHGDLVQTSQGEWYMVLLGIRPYDCLIEDYSRYQPRKWIRTPDRNKNAQFNLGRETFLVPIAWDEDDWPIVDNENGLVNLNERRPNLLWHRESWDSNVDNFEETKLSLQWCMQRPPQTEFYSLANRPGWLQLTPLSARAEDRESSATILRRQQHNNFQAATVMEFEPVEGEEGGLLLTQNERFSYLLVKAKEKGDTRIEVIRIENGIRVYLNKVSVSPGKVYLFIEGKEGAYDFYYGMHERDMIPLYQNADASYLSTIVADGYVGVLIGPYAAYTTESSGHTADFDWFRYEAIEE